MSTIIDVDASSRPCDPSRADHGDQGRPRRAGRVRRGGRAHARSRRASRGGSARSTRSRSAASRKKHTPLLGGLAIFGGALVAGLLFLPDNQRTEGILAAAALITIVGALDDVYDLHPALKLLGQIAAAVVLVTSGVQVDAFTFPFLHRVELGDFGGPATVLALVLLMNVVNFSDGVDGLAAGVCAIAAAAFSIIAFDLGRNTAGILAAIVCGAALGFLLFNFHPASVFMGDCGSNLLGLLLGAVIIEGTLKTNALIALVGPLVVLAVPFLDTGFVVAKRLKYRRSPCRGDSNHFHHRFHRIGFSQRALGALPLRVDADHGRRSRSRCGSSPTRSARAS